MIKDQCNNCRKNGTSSCTKSIIYDSRPCDEYVKKLDLSKQDNQNQTYNNPVQQPAPQNNNQGSTVNNNQSTFASVFSFKGRIRRTQYWLTNFIIGLLFVPANISNDISEGVAIYTLLIFIPAMWVSLANIVKRFHDLGRSGWFACFLFIPIANIIFGIYAAFFKGQEHDNEYGPNPYYFKRIKFMIYILRNNQKYGPYNDSALVSYVNSGQLLLVDTLIDDTTGVTTTVRRYLKKHNIKVKVQHGGSFVNQLNKIGTELLVPKDAFKKKSIITDTRLILLGLVGLVPSILMFLPIGGFFVFYLVSLYFAIIWGLFFYYFFKTPQVSIKTTILVFFITQAAVFLIWDILGLPALNPFYNLVDTVFPLTLFGYIFGVGLTEELGKALPLFIINHRTNVPLIPQTLVFYGLMSGIAFGVFEGVQYQMTINAEQEYTTAYFLNILRLTSLPFIHAVWCGIAGYFISFASLYPKYRIALYFLAIAIPALLHGIYDTFCGSLLGSIIALPTMFVTVILLNAYLKQGVNYQSKLRN